MPDKNKKNVKADPKMGKSSSPQPKRTSPKDNENNRAADKKQLMERAEKWKQESNEKAQNQRILDQQRKIDKERRETMGKARKPRKKTTNKSVGKPMPKTEPKTKGAGKMPDGYNMERPAEKLGYIQKLGAARMSPGQQGDMTAMKMMHGDAAAKYYDGGGKFMNGAPKYIGASKSYIGAMKHVAGHDDRPSYTRQTTTTSVVPGTQSSVSTTTSGGSSQSKTKLEKAKSGTRTKQSDSDYMTSLSKNKKFSGRSGSEMAEAGHISKSNIGAYDKIAGTSSSGGSTSSKSTTSKSTKPTVKTEVKKEKITSKRKSGAQVMAEGKEAEMNRAARQKAGMAEMMNIAKKDSANIAEGYLKGKKVTPKNLEIAVKKGNIAGYRTLIGLGKDRGSFDQQGIGRDSEFAYTREEASKAFPSDIGKATATSMGGRAKGRGKVPAGEQFTLNNPNYSSSDIGKVKKFSKSGQYKITDVKTDPGTAGSYGGYSSAKEYMDAMGLSAGSPKMPKGPMKFGMRK